MGGRGILIRKALYGDLRLKHESYLEVKASGCTIREEHLAGPWIEVTIPLQCLVEDHMIVLPGSFSASKADLPGFYNPAPLDMEVELSLYVLYEFRGTSHEVTVDDYDTLRMPLQKHAVRAGKVPRGPFSSANVALMHGSDRREPGTTKAERQRKCKEQRAHAEDALHQAMVAYRFEGMCKRAAGEATLKEFLAVVLVSVGSFAGGFYWVRGTVAAR
eukprot:NODE_2733_length_885_cov_377.040964.p1 GENE.NODE_2733_length_885_cov_377.040964~~NODE_2733_length_885_cov_377.040964.p1  ORF type:complete len:217 (-),score=71.09 NODE_2733_length_885_cov_377.040964:217-867(-)